MSHALRSLQIPAYVNERHDICVEQFKMSPNDIPSASQLSAYLLDAYVSGSAFKLTSNRAYHHGTMLIDADLEALRGVLRNNKVRFLYHKKKKSHIQVTLTSPPNNT